MFVLPFSDCSSLSECARLGVHGYHDGGAERIDLRPIDGMEMESILHGSRKPVECLER